MGLLVAVLLLLVLPMGVGAATAQTTITTNGSVSSINVALGWTGVIDTSRVPLSSYVYVGAGESIFHPIRTSMTFVLVLVFEGWIVIVITGIWVIGYGLSFRWLNVVGIVLIRVSDKLSGQLTTTIIVVVFATTGSFFVAYFVVRGFHAKATMQVATMLLVAVIGPLYLAHPLSDVMASDGLLAQGRDLGITVAAGLNGTDTTDPTSLVSTLQTDLADNFVRHPLQVWNYGHVIDANPVCKDAWSSAMATGNDGTVKAALQSCGDNAAYSSANNPTIGQIGAGIILLLSGAILLLFGVYLAVKVIKSTVGVIWCGFMAIVGFAGSGFIYGPPQIFLVRNIVDGFIAAGEMALYVIFTGMYVLFMGDLFDAAGGQVMAVFMIGAIVEVVAISQLRHIGASMQRARQWTTNRLGMAIQGAGGGGGGGGGTAFGMGGAAHSMTAMGALGNISALNGNPLVEWAMLGTPNPISPFSRLNKKMTKLSAEVNADPKFAGKKGAGAQGMMNRLQFSKIAKERAGKHGGVNTALGAAEGLAGMILEGGGSLADGWGTLTALGLKDRGRGGSIKLNAVKSWGAMERQAESYIGLEGNAARVAASIRQATKSTRQLAKGEASMTPERAAADIATMRAVVRYYREIHPGGVRLTGDPNHHDAVPGFEHAIAMNYFNNPTLEKMKTFQALASRGVDATWVDSDEISRVFGVDDATAADWGTLTGLGSKRIVEWSNNEFAKSVDEAAHRYWLDPSYGNQRTLRSAGERLQTNEQNASGTQVGSGLQVAPPSEGNARGPRNYNNVMESVRRELARSADLASVDIG
ncbi:hypothetical protein [Nocardia sp. GAS34]|uniref:hypothetical protein n=1 Tax=unclassified Nocardia TaxID=2637762 RepID=UPI003D1F0084